MEKPAGIRTLTDSIRNDSEWFWHWVEWNQSDESLLPAWFKEASPEDLKTFWRVYFHEVLAALVLNEGDLMPHVTEAEWIEADWSDFSNWVIVQGKELWSRMKAECDSLRKDPNSYDIRNITSLRNVFVATQNPEVKQGKKEWLGISWVPRLGYFPGDMADYMYEDRFGLTLWEQTSS
jgi:hypothetical protein